MKKLVLCLFVLVSVFAGAQSRIEDSICFPVTILDSLVARSYGYIGTDNANSVVSLNDPYGFGISGDLHLSKSGTIVTITGSATDMSGIGQSGGGYLFLSLDTVTGNSYIHTSRSDNGTVTDIQTSNNNGYMHQEIRDSDGLVIYNILPNGSYGAGLVSTWQESAMTRGTGENPASGIRVDSFNGANIIGQNMSGVISNWSGSPPFPGAVWYAYDANNLGWAAADSVIRGSGWSLTGNAGTNPSVNFIGTSDNTALNISRNSNPIIHIDNIGGILDRVQVKDSLGNILLSTQSNYPSSTILVSLGDVSNAYNGTQMQIQDGNKAITSTDSVFVNNGKVQIVDGSQGIDKILASDANGLASWTTNTGGHATLQSVTDSGSATTNEMDIVDNHTNNLISISPNPTNDFTQNFGEIELTYTDTFQNVRRDIVFDPAFIQYRNDSIISADGHQSIIKTVYPYAPDSLYIQVPALTNGTPIYRINGIGANNKGLAAVTSASIGVTSGTYSVTGSLAQTAFVVTHGLGYTPSFVGITPTALGSAVAYYVTAIGSTTFTVNFVTSPGAVPVSFLWSSIK